MTEMENKKSPNFTRDVLTIASGTVLSQVIAALAIPIITRLYSAENYGVYSLFVSIITIIGSIATLKYEFSIALPEDEIEALNQFSLSAIVALIFNILLFFILIFIKPLLTKFFDQEIAQKLIFLIPFTSFLIGINYSLVFWNIRRNDFRNISINKISKETFKDIFQLFPSVLGIFKSIVLIYAESLAWLITTLVFYKNSFKGLAKDIAESLNSNILTNAFKKYIKFPKYSAFSTFINSLALQLPVLLISIFFSKSFAGEFAISNNILRVPLTFIGNSIGQVFYNRVSAILGDKEKITKLVHNTVISLLELGAIPVIFLGIFGQESLKLFLGSKWEMAGVITQLLAPWILFNFISVPLSNLPNLLNKQEFLLIFNFILVISKFLSLWIGSLFNDFLLGMLLFSLTGAILYGALSIWLCSISGIKPKVLLAEILNYFLKISPIIAILVIIKIMDLNVFLRLALAVISAIVFYFYSIRKNQGIKEIFGNDLLGLLKIKK